MNVKNTSRTIWHHLTQWWHRSWIHKTITVALVAIIIVVACMFAIAQWYIHSQSAKPMEYGVSFIPTYARDLGVEPKQTFDALLGIGVRHFRLVSYWKTIEPTPGQYNFDELDWQFKKAEAAHAKITLTLGLRQPRWPECHEPVWVDTTQPLNKWQPQLETFMQKVIERYKLSPALDKYQLENEYFLKGFGNCKDMSRTRLVDEYRLVKKLDPHHDIVIPRSNNAIGFPVGKPTPDEWSISVYKRVWDAAVTHRYLEYPFPSWFYGYIAGVQQLVWHRNMMIAELQAEPWPPHGQDIANTSLEEQNKSFDAKRFEGRFELAHGTGMKEVYFWGAEYWYYRKTVLHDNSVWNVAQEHFTAND